MASLFRARRLPEAEEVEDEGRGSGGKLLRGRRPAPRLSPYYRPPPPLPLPPPPASPGSPRWLLDLISGAGKLISSVFRSDGSSSSDSDKEISLSSDGEEDMVASSKELHEINQGGNKQELITDGMQGSQAIVLRSDAKLAIEQLLRQETFSREECDRLTKIIQSRVMDSPSMEIVADETQKEISSRTTSGDLAISGAWRSLNRNRKLRESIPYSPNKLGALSWGSSAHQECAPYLRSNAVMEAKKWLEEKKLASSSKSDLDCGPCTLNTDMVQYHFEGEVGSPVDLAKSYMHSLPPWQSPSLSSSGFKTPPPIGTHLGKTEVAYAATNYSLPSKVLKRNYNSIGLWDTLDETRRVRLKSSDNTLEITGFKQSDSSSRLFGNDTSKISSAADGNDVVLGAKHDRSSLQPTETYDASVKLSSELHVEDHFSDRDVGLPDEKAVEVYPPKGTSNATSIDFASGSEAVTSVQLSRECPFANTDSLEPVNPKTESETDVHDLEENKGVMELSQTKEQDSIIDATRESLVLASTTVDHDGVNLSQPDQVASDDIKCAAPSADHATNTGDQNVRTSSIQMLTDTGGVTKGSNNSHLNLVSDLKETCSIADTFTDSKPQDGKPEIQNEANGSIHKFSVNGSFAESNANSDLESFSKEDPSFTDSSSREPTAGITGGTVEIGSEAAADVSAAHGGNSVADGPQNGTRMKTIERMLAEPQPNTSRHGKKSVVKARRGRRRAR